MGARVLAAVPAQMPASRLGPASPGHDGQPAATALSDGSLWVVASRSDGPRSALWAQSFRDNRWRRAERGPSAGTQNRHPGLAAGGDALWAVWIASGDTGIGARSALYASRRSDDGWSPPERLPQPNGEPMAPAIAVDGNGLPAVVWASGDGGHAEIWVSWRSPRGWSAPLALSDDDTPDASPSIAVSASRWTIAWSSFRRNAYWTEAVVGHPRRGWGASQRISRRAGSSPRALATEEQLSVVWAVPEAWPGSTRSVLRWSRLGAGGWQRPRDVVLSTNADFAAAVGADGRLWLGWTNLRGSLTVAESDGPFRTVRAGGLRVVRGRPDDAAAPSTFGAPVMPKISSASRWLAFGDSITEGYTKIGGTAVIDSGYPAELQSRLRAVLGGGVQVFNQGKGGETTIAGVNRFPSALAATNPSGAVIMEGTNDVSNGFSDSLVAFNLYQMAKMATDAGVTTLLAAVPPRDEQGFGGPDNAATNTVNAHVPASAAAAGASIVDTHDPLMGRGDLFADHTHPNPAGYDFMGGLVFAAINTLPSDGAGATTAPGTPTDLEVVVTGSTVTVRWAAPTSGGAPSSYRIQAGSAPFGNDLADFDTGNAGTSFTATNVGNVTLNVTVRAVNAAGTSGQSNNAVATVGGGTNTCSSAAGVPQSVTASASGSLVTIRWTAAPDQSATSYMIEAGSATGLSDLASFDTGAASTTFVANGVAAGTYFLRLRAVNACGVSGASSEAILIVS